MNTEEFIKKSKNVFHKEEWDYSQTVYNGPNTKVKIICKYHGEFFQLPFSHLSGHGCPKCSRRSQKYEIKEWLEKANEVNKGKFEYKIDKYVNQNQKVVCVCHEKDENGNEHGCFERTCKQVIMGTYCPKCRAEARRLEKEKNAIKQCEKIHNGKYDYSKFKYRGMLEKVTVICPIHGEFYPQLNNHMVLKSGCPKCALEKQGVKQRMTYEEFIQKAKNLYGETYDLSLIKQEDICGCESKLKFICPIHGVFQKSVHNFLGGQGCPKCSNERIKECLRLGNDKWIERFNTVHNGKYTYNLTKPISYSDKIIIQCPIHGDFIQKVGNHANGQGCPKCRTSRLEREMIMALEKCNIEFEYQKKFDWLGRQSLDFYLPQYNIAIECQGSQHFEEDKFYKELKIVQDRDDKKRLLREKNNVELIYYLNEKYVKQIDNLNNRYFTTTDDLLHYITTNDMLKVI